MTKTCLVTECRYDNQHTTSEHQCGRCHGQLECGNPTAISSLTNLTYNRASPDYARFQALKIFQNQPG